MAHSSANINFEADSVLSDIFPHHTKSNDEKSLFHKLSSLLSGIPPPPSVATCKLSCSQMLESLKLNIDLLEFKKVDTPIEECNPRVFYLNSNILSEEITDLTVKLQARFVQSETASSYSIQANIDRQLSNSARKRRQWNGISPGRRLSHLAKRRQMFSKANLQQMSKNEPKVHRFAISKPSTHRNLAKEYLEYKEATSKDRNLPKRALFQSPEDDVMQGFRTVARNVPRRKLFEKPERSAQLPSGGGSYDVSGWLASQPFMGGKKRSREESRDSDRKRKCPRRSLDFSDGSQCSDASALSSGAHQIPPPNATLTQVHKQKLLWAVAVALKEKKITHKDSRFKKCATNLFTICKKNLALIKSLTVTGGTSEKMLTYARSKVDDIINESDHKTLLHPAASSASGILLDLSQSTLNKKHNDSKDTNIMEGKENGSKTPKRIKSVRQWRSCIKTKRKRNLRLHRSLSCDDLNEINEKQLKMTMNDSVIECVGKSPYKIKRANKRRRDDAFNINDSTHNDSFNDETYEFVPVRDSIILETPEKLENNSDCIPGSQEDVETHKFPALNGNQCIQSKSFCVRSPDLFEPNDDYSNVSQTNSLVVYESSNILDLHTLKSKHCTTTTEIKDIFLDTLSDPLKTNAFPIDLSNIHSEENDNFANGCTLKNSQISPEKNIFTNTSMDLISIKPVNSEMLNGGENTVHISVEENDIFSCDEKLINNTLISSVNILDNENNENEELGGIDIFPDNEKLINNKLLSSATIFELTQDDDKSIGNNFSLNEINELVVDNDPLPTLFTDIVLNESNITPLELEERVSDVNNIDFQGDSVESSNSIDKQEHIDENRNSGNELKCVDNHISLLVNESVLEKQNITYSSESEHVDYESENVSSSSEETEFSSKSDTEKENISCTSDEISNVEDNSCFINEENGELSIIQKGNEDGLVDVIGMDDEKQNNICTSTPIVEFSKKLTIKSKPAWRLETGPGLKILMRLSKDWDIVGRSKSLDSDSSEALSCENNIDIDLVTKPVQTLIDNSLIRKICNVESSATSMESYTMNEIKDRLAIEKTLGGDNSDLSLFHSATSIEISSKNENDDPVQYNKSIGKEESAVNILSVCEDLEVERTFFNDNIMDQSTSPKNKQGKTFLPSIDRNVHEEPKNSDNVAKQFLDDDTPLIQLMLNSSRASLQTTPKGRKPLSLLKHNIKKDDVRYGSSKSIEKYDDVPLIQLVSESSKSSVTNLPYLCTSTEVSSNLSKEHSGKSVSDKSTKEKCKNKFNIMRESFEDVPLIEFATESSNTSMADKSLSLNVHSIESNKVSAKIKETGPNNSNVLQLSLDEDLPLIQLVSTSSKSDKPSATSCNDSMESMCSSENKISDDLKEKSYVELSDDDVPLIQLLSESSKPAITELHCNSMSNKLNAMRPSIDENVPLIHLVPECARQQPCYSIVSTQNNKCGNKDMSENDSNHSHIGDDVPLIELVSESSRYSKIHKKCIDSSEDDVPLSQLADNSASNILKSYDEVIDQDKDNLPLTHLKNDVASNNENINESYDDTKKYDLLLNQLNQSILTEKSEENDSVSSAGAEEDLPLCHLISQNSNVENDKIVSSDVTNLARQISEDEENTPLLQLSKSLSHTTNHLADINKSDNTEEEVRHFKEISIIKNKSEFNINKTKYSKECSMPSSSNERYNNHIEKNINTPSKISSVSEYNSDSKLMPMSGGSDASSGRTKAKLSLESYKARKKLVMEPNIEVSPPKKIYNIRLKKKERHSKIGSRRRSSHFRESSNDDLDDESHDDSDNMEKSFIDKAKTFVDAFSTISCMVEQEMKLTVSAISDDKERKRKLRKLSSVSAMSENILQSFLDQIPQVKGILTSDT